MPQASGDVPQTPTRRTSSSALLGAFRSITGGRNKNPIQPSPSPASSLTPTQETLAPADTFAVDDISDGDQSSGSGNEARSAAIANGSQEHPADGTNRGRPLGGPSDLSKLVRVLRNDGVVSERIQAVYKVVPILEEYPVRNVHNLLDAAGDLLDIPDDAEAHVAAYTLLTTCASHSELSSIERRTLFQAIATARSHDELGMRMRALNALTNGGRSIETCEADIASLLTGLLKSSFKVIIDVRKHNKTHKSKVVSEEETSLNTLFDFIYNVTKFNAKAFRENDLEALAARIVAICRKTTVKTDIKNSIRMIDALITFTEIPYSALRPCIEVLCDVCRQLKEFEDDTWATLMNLFKSHLGGSSVSALLAILLDPSQASKHNHNVVRGAVYVLQVFLLRNGRDGLPVIPLSDVLPALDSASRLEHLKLVVDILQLLYQILGHIELVELLLSESDWSVLSVILRRGCKVQQAAERAGPKGSESTISQVSSRSRLVAAATTYLGQISTILNDLVPRMDIYQKEAVMDLFTHLGNYLDDAGAETVVRYYTEERLLYPLQEPYLDLATSLLETLFTDRRRPRNLRALLLQGLSAGVPLIGYLYEHERFAQFVSLVLENILFEDDVMILRQLTDFAVRVAVDARDNLFDNIFSLLESSINDRKGVTYVPPENLGAWASSTTPRPTQQLSSSLCNVLVRSVVRMYLRTINTSAYKAKKLYGLLLTIAGSADFETDSRITAMKLLFRIRADSTNAIRVISQSESERIAAVLCRTVETALPEQTGEGVSQRQSRNEEQTTARDNRSTSSSSPHASMSRHVTRSASGPLRGSKPVPPFWMYPGPRGLPEEPAAGASPVIFSQIDVDQGTSDEPVDENDVSSSVEERTVLSRDTLDITSWLDVVTSLLKHGTDWEVYSYVLVHLGAQLVNHSLFTQAIPSIGALQILLWEQIRSSTYQEPPGYTSLKRADVAVCLHHILTTLVSYHSYFRKESHDEMVRAFSVGLVSDRTAKWAIHALTVCCHEFPLSTGKCLDTILHRMSTIITQPNIAIHILEFLAALARLPELYKNFRDEDYKMVFGICFRYLQYVRDQRERSISQASDRSAPGSVRHSGLRDVATPAEQEGQSKLRSPSDDLPQYVYAIAFHVITFWFMSLKMQDRPTYMGWIAKNLTYLDQTGKEVVEEQSQVTIDMMQRVGFSDRDETKLDPNFAQPADGNISTKTWIVGLSLMTIETAGRTGVSQITRRRPSGTRYATYRPQLSKPATHQVPVTTGLEADTFYTQSYIGILPDDIIQEFYSPFNFPTSSGSVPEFPIPLPEDEAVGRVISSIDRMPAVDGHKVGVIFIDEGQTTETEIYANAAGSLDYTQFISGLGTLIRLKGATFNVQGLDREFDSDGEHTICWRDRVTEIVFHITTLMPTDLDHDPQCINKKRHTGNDFVNIIFNNSGQLFDFDTFPSAFNYVYIVITPISRLNPVRNANAASEEGPIGGFYTVQVISQTGFPEISPAAEPKVISGKSLPGYVRLLALNASFFSLVWASRAGGENISSWRNRLREIQKLRTAYCNKDQPVVAPTPPPTGYGPPSATGTGMPVQPARDSIVSVGPFKRASAATFFSDASRNSVLSNATEMERQPSDHSRG